MKKLLFTLTCGLVAAATGFAQTQTISYNDNLGTANAGSYAAGSSFSVDVFLTLSGYNTGGIGKSSGLSYWLQTNTALAPYISITSVTYFTFTDGNSTGDQPFVFDDSSGASSGFLSERGQFFPGDLGGTDNIPTQDVADGTYQVTTLTFTLSGLAPAATYTIGTTTASPKGSEATDRTGTNPNFIFTPHNIPASNYTLTVTAVPEPATWSLLGLGGLATVGLNVLRRRRA